MDDDILYLHNPAQHKPDYDGDWGGMRGVDDTCLPQTMDVDYVRVYQSKEISP